MCFTTDLVVEIDFDLDVIASIMRRDVFSRGREASFVLCISDETSVNSVASSITSFLSVSSKVFLEPNLVGVCSRDSTDPSSEASTGCGMPAWEGVRGCDVSNWKSCVDIPLDRDGSDD